MGRLRGFWMGLREGWRTVLIALGVLFFLIVLDYLLFKFLPNSGDFKDVSGIIQSIITALAIVMAGYFALFKLRIFRDLEPHLTVSHEISHRFIGDSYVHISVTALLHNRSKVKVELREGFFRLQKIAPTTDEDIHPLYEQVFICKKYEDIQWPLLDELKLTRCKGELVVEPGESHPETHEFIVLREVRSVLAYTYFKDPEYSSGPESAEGWHATSVYDINICE